VGALLVTTVLLWRARAIAEPVLLEALAPAVVSSVVALITAGSVRSALPLDLHPLLEAGLVAAMFGLVYVGALRVLFRRPLAEIVSELPHATRMSRALRLA
jgi:hypothetical protein